MKETILNEGSFATTQSGTQMDKNQNHRGSFFLKHDLDSLTRISLRVGFRTNGTRSFVLDTVQSTRLNGSQNSSEQNYNAVSGLIELSPTLNLMHRFQKRGRSATLTGNFKTNPQDKNVDLTTANAFTPADTNLLLRDTLIQNQVQDQGLLSYGGRIGYTEPFGRRHAVEAYVQYQATDNRLLKDFFDLDALNGNPVRNSFLSSNYATTYSYEKGGLNWRYFVKNLNLTTGIAIQNSSLFGEIYTTNTVIRKQFLNVLPSVQLRLQMRKSQNIRGNYTTRVVEPTVAQLQPIPDNSNPLNISVGNPDLRAEYAHSMRLNYSLFDQFSFTSFFAGVSGTYTRNKISQLTTIDSLLRQVTKPVNVSNDLQTSAFLSFSTPIRKLKIKFAVNGNSTASRSLVYINGELNVVNRFTNGGDIKIENKTKNHFDANVGARTSYTVTQYPSASRLNQSYINSGLFGEISLFLPKKFVVMTGMDCSIYSAVGSTPQRFVPLWRAYVSKKIFKNSRGEIRISAYDILNRNIGISRTAQLNYQQQETVNTLSRYFLGSFTYSIVSVGKKH